MNKLLQYLVTEYPDEGWEPFYYAGEPAWNKVTLSGHSQGGGFAAYIAASERVARVARIFGAERCLERDFTADPRRRGSAAVMSRRSIVTSRSTIRRTRPSTPRFKQNCKTLGLDGYGALVDVDDDFAALWRQATS